MQWNHYVSTENNTFGEKKEQKKNQKQMRPRPHKLDRYITSFPGIPWNIEHGTWKEFPFHFRSFAFSLNVCQSRKVILIFHTPAPFCYQSKSRTNHIYVLLYIQPSSTQFSSQNETNTFDQ